MITTHPPPGLDMFASSATPATAERTAISAPAGPTWSQKMAAAHPERLTENVHTKLTPSEVAQLDWFIALCNQQGMSVTRSSVIRTFVQSALRGVADELGQP